MDMVSTLFIFFQLENPEHHFPHKTLQKLQELGQDTISSGGAWEPAWVE